MINPIFLLYYLPVVLAGYYLLAVFRRAALQNVFLLVASLAFLLWLEPLLLPLLVLQGLFTFVLGRRVKAALWENKSTKGYIIASYVSSGGIFLLLQALAMLANYGVPLFGLEHTLLRTMVVPVGMGIMALRSISYVSDIGRQRIDADKNLLNVLLYLTFFPQFAIGPLYSYHEFQPQLEREFQAALFQEGVSRFVVGVGKIILLAGNLAVVSDRVFSLSAASDSLTKTPVTLAWLGLAAFVLQVYYDLTGLTDIAVGLSAMFGFSVPENFRYPYLADSVTEFWRRWMITIKKWFDRYVARPLDQRRSVNADHLLLNTFLAFVAMGIWHKMSIGMLIWAFLQVLCLTVEKTVTYDQRSIPRAVKHGYVLLVILAGCALLRYSNFYHSLLFLRNLTGLNQNGFFSSLAVTLLQEYGAVLLAGLLFLFPIAAKLRRKISHGGRLLQSAASVAYLILLCGVAYLCMLYIARGLYAPTPYLF